VDTESKLRIEEASVTSSFLKAEADRAEDDVKAKERAIAEFLTKHPEFAAETGTQSQGPGGLAVIAHAVRQGQAVRSADPPRVQALVRQEERLRARLASPNSAPVVTHPEAPSP